MRRSQRLEKPDETAGRYRRGERIGLSLRNEDDPVFGSERGHAFDQAGSHLGGKGALDLHGQHFAVGRLDDEVHLRAGDCRSRCNTVDASWREIISP